jgi:carbonic anhydrase
VLQMMKRGNHRFRAGMPLAHDYLAQKRASATGQYPAAVIVGCIDSRVPAKIILDAGMARSKARSKTPSSAA